MALKTAEEYVERLKRMKPNVYAHGAKIGRDDPILELKNGKVFINVGNFVTGRDKELELSLTDILRRSEGIGILAHEVCMLLPDTADSPAVMEATLQSAIRSGSLPTLKRLLDCASHKAHSTCYHRSSDNSRNSAPIEAIKMNRPDMLATVLNQAWGVFLAS